MLVTRTPTSTDHRGSLVDDAVALYEQAYDSRDINVGAPAESGFSYRLRSVGDPDVTVGTSQVAARRWGTIRAGHEYVLAWATSPGMTIDTSSRTPVQMEPGVPVVYPVGRDFGFDGLPSGQHSVRFAGTFLEGVAAARRGDAPRGLVLRPALDPAALVELRTRIGTAAPHLFSTASSAEDRARWNRDIADAVAAAFDETPSLAPSGSVGTATVRFAREWMVANARRQLTIADVSAATGVSARGLQAAFQRHVGMRPMQFLREARLAGVRADLLASDPATTTVAEVARSWCFQHLGRFSGYYAEEFGETPSETLREARRSRPAA
jgi:AraC-like DNA-binding protein